MKKTFLSLLFAIGLIGSASSSVITITDNTSGDNASFDSQYFPAVTPLSLPFTINTGDSLNFTWNLSGAFYDQSGAFIPPSYANTDGSSGTFHRSQRNDAVGNESYSLNTQLSFGSQVFNDIFTYNIGSTIGANNIQPSNITLIYSALSDTENPTLQWINNYTQIYSETGSYQNPDYNTSWGYVPPAGVGIIPRYLNYSYTTQKNWTDSVQASVIPEPSTYALFGIGAIGLLMVLRRKKTT
jgi:hypothetical protein